MFSSSSIQEWPQMVSFSRILMYNIQRILIRLTWIGDKLKHIIEDRIGRFPDEYKRLYEQRIYNDSR